jgi:oligoribonuclease
VKQATSKSPAYLWFDTEFTSLDLDAAHLLQVSMVVTDPDLQRMVPADRDLNLYVQVLPDTRLSSWVEENIPNVLLRCRGAEAVPAEELNQRVCDYIDTVVGAPARDIAARPVLAGNSLHADWTLARRLLPGVIDRIHYRMLDVTALKLQWQDWLGGLPFDKEDIQTLRRCFPGLVTEEGAGQHDAYYDVQASIAELAYYRQGFKG